MKPTAADFVFIEPGASASVRRRLPCRARSAPLSYARDRRAPQFTLDLSAGYQFIQGRRYRVVLGDAPALILRGAFNGASDLARLEAVRLALAAPVELLSPSTSELPLHRSRRLSLASAGADVTSRPLPLHHENRLLTSYGLTGCSAYTSQLSTAISQVTNLLVMVAGQYFPNNCADQAYTLYFGAYNAARYANVSMHFSKMNQLYQGNSRCLARCSLAIAERPSLRRDARRRLGRECVHNRLHKPKSVRWIDVRLGLPHRHDVHTASVHYLAAIDHYVRPGRVRHPPRHHCARVVPL